jgi:hypothetical protein
MTDKHIEDLGKIDRADEGPVGLVAEDRLDLVGRGLTRQRRDDSLRIEDRQRRPFRLSSLAASSSRTKRRSSTVFGPRPAKEPIAAPIGSAGIGRMTRAVPWSSRATLSVPQR